MLTSESSPAIANRHGRQRPGVATIAGVAVLLALQLGVFACSSRVNPMVTVGPTMPLTLEPKIYVIASSQVQRVHQAMTDAGLPPAKTREEANYLLQVNIGAYRGSRDCGPTNNVAYILNAHNQRILVMKGRGRTGACKPNIIDDMSRTLASLFKTYS